MAKYEYVDSQKSELTNTNPVTKMCRWLGVSTSGFYHWLGRPQSATAARRAALTRRVRHFFEDTVAPLGAAADERTSVANRLGQNSIAQVHGFDRPRRDPAKNWIQRKHYRREYAIGVEALERLAAREPLWKIHLAVFALLAMGSEPVDPRL